MNCLCNLFSDDTLWIIILIILVLLLACNSSTGTNTGKADKILSDPPDGIIIRLFCERFAPRRMLVHLTGQSHSLRTLFTYPHRIKGSC